MALHESREKKEHEQYLLSMKKREQKMLLLAWKFKYMYENMLTIIHLRSSHHFLSTWGMISFERKKTKIMTVLKYINVLTFHNLHK